MKSRGFGAWKEIVKFIWTIFSILPLAKAFFVPFHREAYGSSEGASLFERVVFNILMRLMGAIARLFIIILGLLALGFSLLLLPFFVLFNIPLNSERLYRRRAFGRDLSFRWTPHLKRAAREYSHNKPVPLIGKEEAMLRLEQVLSRSTQNNALVVGDPGVGRTTLVTQFANRVAWGQTLPALRYRHVFELSLEGMESDDLRALLVEAVEAGNVIVILDNLHAYPHLFDAIINFTEVPQLQIIGITDTEHYHSSLKSHAALLQRFEKVEVSEPDISATIALVEASLFRDEITVEEGVAAEIVRLTDRLVMHVPQPEKSLDVVEELLSASPKHIGISDVHALMTLKSGVPVGQIQKEERETLMNLKETLLKSIVGQEEVVQGITEALKRGRSGVGSEKRPIGSFLLLGPTGVGKTHTAKKLAEAYYGSEEKMVRFDMTEFAQEKSAEDFAHRLVVAIEENPFTLVLFDEIEKAHTKTLNLFLQILDEARITDASGRQAQFYNAFIICTSNAASDLVVKDKHISQEHFLERVIEKGILSPEFLNRFDGVFLFRPLEREHATQIAQLMLEDFRARLERDKGLKISYDEHLVEELASVAGSSLFGAREIRRLLEQTVESYIADKIIDGSAVPGSTISVPATLVTSKP
jgi:ATP-dependent Clp protease ATP-binding subunit ClpC